jgi:hypothetical protein
MGYLLGSLEAGAHTKATLDRSSRACSATRTLALPASSQAARSANVAVSAAGMRVVCSPAVIEKLLITTISIHCVI